MKRHTIRYDDEYTPRELIELYLTEIHSANRDSKLAKRIVNKIGPFIAALAEVIQDNEYRIKLFTNEVENLRKQWNDLKDFLRPKQ